MTGRPTGRPRVHDAPTPVRPTPALRFDLTCPDCGADVELVAGGVPGRFRTSVLVQCSECVSGGNHPRRFMVTAAIKAVGS